MECISKERPKEEKTLQKFVAHTHDENITICPQKYESIQSIRVCETKYEALQITQIVKTKGEQQKKNERLAQILTKEAEKSMCVCV